MPPREIRGGIFFCAQERKQRYSQKKKNIFMRISKEIGARVWKSGQKYSIIKL